MCQPHESEAENVFASEKKIQKTSTMKHRRLIVLGHCQAFD